MKNTKINLLLSMLVLALSTCILIYILSHDVEEIKMASSVIKKIFITIVLFGLISVVMFYLIKFDIDKSISNKNKNDDDDEFGVANFSENLAKFLTEESKIKKSKLKKSTKNSESIIIGLEGEWGEGKTTIKKSILEKIDRNKIHLVDFSIWEFSGAHSVVEIFFNMVITELKGENKSKELIKLIVAYSNFITPLFTEINTTAFTSILNKFMSNQIPAKQDLREYLEKRNKKLLIVIDDLDRISYKELLIMFQIIKAIFNLPNVKFLVMYSNKNIKKLMQNHNDFNDDFFEKIIDLRIPMPLIDTKIVINHRIDKIQTIFSEFTNNNLETLKDIKFIELFERLAQNQFISHRDFTKFITYLEYELVMLKKIVIMQMNFRLIMLTLFS